MKGDELRNELEEKRGTKEEFKENILFKSSSFEFSKDCVSTR